MKNVSFILTGKIEQTFCQPGDIHQRKRVDPGGATVCGVCVFSCVCGCSLHAPVSPRLPEMRS